MDIENATFFPSLISKATGSQKKLFQIWDIHELELGQNFLEIPKLQFGAPKSLRRAHERLVSGSSNAAFFPSLISKTTWNQKNLFGIWDVHMLELGQNFL